MENFFTKLFEYIGSRSNDETQYFVETLFADTNLFETTSFSPEQYQRLRMCYNTHVRPKCSLAIVHHPFPGATIEERLAFLEQEHQNTRVIQASFVDLLREHRESFDAQLARLHASI